MFNNRSFHIHIHRECSTCMALFHCLMSLMNGFIQVFRPVMCVSDQVHLSEPMDPLLKVTRLN
nr:hypothetical protein Iba_chr09cCG12590 [Ipomoea batatas]